MANLKKKRVDTLEVILLTAGLGGFATFAPTPTIEIPKQVVLGAADIGMCLKIWKIYFSEEIEEKKLTEILSGAGLIAVVTGGTGYVVAKGATGLLHEALNLTTLPGWLTSGVIASSATLLLGFACMIYCETRYKRISGEVTPVWKEHVTPIISWEDIPDEIRMELNLRGRLKSLELRS